MINENGLQQATAIIDNHIDFYEIDESQRSLVNMVLGIVRKNYGAIEYDNLINDFELQVFGVKTIL